MKRILLFFTLLICFSSFVSAAAYQVGTVDNEKLYSPFNLSSGTASWDLIGDDNNFTLNNGVAWKPGIWGNAIECDGSDDYLQTTEASDFPYSVSFFFKTTTTGSTKQIFSTLNDNYFHINMTSDGTIVAYTQGGFKATVTTANNYYNNGSWFFIAVQDDLHNLKVLTYSGGVRLENLTNDKGGSSGDINPVQKTLCKGKGGAYWNGTIEDILITSDNLTYAEMAIRGTQSTTPPIDDTLNITNLKPVNNSGINYNVVDVNATIQSKFPTEVNCSIYVNNTLNVTDTTVASSINFTINFATNTDYLVNLSCKDNTTEESTLTLLHIDTILPDITFYIPYSNNTYILVGQDNLTANITIEDPNLYSYYYNISWTNGTNIYNFSNQSLTGFDNHNITDSGNMSSYRGLFESRVEVCDGHTNEKIKFKYVDKIGNDLYYDDVSIEPVYETYDITEVNTKYKTDRYSFEYKLNKSKNYQEYMIYSNTYIDILHGETSYLGHLVTGNKWIDFETDDVKSITINRISANIVLVKVKKNIATTDWNFNSIGELNCRNATKYFFTINPTTDWELTTYSGLTETYEVNVSYNTSYISSVDVDLIYNGTKYDMIGTILGDEYRFRRNLAAPSVTTESNVSVIFQYTINGLSYNTTIQNQTIVVPDIDNCSTYTNQLANFTLRDEITGNLLSGDFEYVFDISVGSFSGTYNGSVSGVNNVSFCMNPPNANFTSDITISYVATGYTQREWIRESYQVDNITEGYNLYLLTSGNSTEVTVHVIDGEDNDLESVLIEAYRWDIPTNTFKMVESEYTDSEGNAIFDLVIGTEYYSFAFYQYGELVLNTTKFKIFSTTLEYVLATQEVSRLQEYMHIRGLSRTLTYSNATNTVTFTWTDVDNLGDRFCLNVSDWNQSWYTGCSNNASGTLSYTITQLNKTYIAQSKVRYTDTDHWFILDTLNIDTRGFWRIFGFANSIVMSFFLILTITLLFMWNKNLAVLGASFSVMVLYLFGFSPISLGTAIGVMCLAAIILLIINKRFE